MSRDEYCSLKALKSDDVLAIKIAVYRITKSTLAILGALPSPNPHLRF